MFKSILKTSVIAAAVLSAVASCCGSSNTALNGSKGTDPIENIMSRKSVRAYSSEKVSDQQITTMLKAAMASPSGMDARPWSFVVLRDTSAYDAIFTKANFNLNMFKNASAVVVFCADTTVSRVPRNAPSGAQPVQEANKIWRDDMGACTENFLLAAESLGLGAVWTACYPYADRMDPVKSALGLPSTVVPYCIVPVGYPAGDNQPKDKWDESRIHYNKW